MLVLPQHQGNIGRFGGRDKAHGRVVQGVAAADDGVDIDLASRLLQQGKAVIVDQIAHQGREGVRAIVDDAIALGFQNIDHQGVKALGVDIVPIRHHRHMLDPHRLVAREGGVFLVGVVAAQGQLVLGADPLGQDGRDQGLADPALALQDEVHRILHRLPLSIINRDTALGRGRAAAHWGSRQSSLPKIPRHRPLPAGAI